jgi:hypothetical protein
MTGMCRYYLSRVPIAAAFGGLFALLGAPWWGGVLAGILFFVWFLLAPRIGRYVVRPELGAKALSRDERTQLIMLKAARNAFIVMNMAVMGIVIYFGVIAPSRVPVEPLSLAMFLSWITYWVSDFRLRRVSSN